MCHSVAIRMAGRRKGCPFRTARVRAGRKGTVPHPRISVMA